MSCPKGRGPSLSEATWEHVAASLRLSGREVQILNGILQNNTPLEIANDLGISVHTVHSHLARLYRKMNVSSRAELILEVFKEYVSQYASDTDSR